MGTAPEGALKPLLLVLLLLRRVVHRGLCRYPPPAVIMSEPDALARRSGDLPEKGGEKAPNAEINAQNPPIVLIAVPCVVFVPPFLLKLTRSTHPENAEIDEIDAAGKIAVSVVAPGVVTPTVLPRRSGDLPKKGGENPEKS